ncbi:uncharacterized protein NEMAJ01_0767 [Nematocida major]|uniref:uncharacterized protein n=1 Tax=Nematocida major TaxID=1912982 RepID=UPI002008539F|nr:uncharacterized protein NEMAJ01_0767 [Nematocida major]KAH9385871.1 hypothetical protein NEMAJ01_0767 [Nematocida major]
MKKEVETIRKLLQDKIPLNIVTLEDEGIIRELYDLHSPEITFNPIYDNSRINICISHSKEEILDLLKDKPNIKELILHNEYYLYSEIKVLASGKVLLPSSDSPSEITPAEEQAIKGNPTVPIELLKENLKSQGKLPVSRAIRITGKYEDE